ncbi:hypothetical protein G9A89_002619 [Geosiphon pyriformis]|nr:hypothetical protein G9A89_002619 [Geosiphon pyriformis]
MFGLECYGQISMTCYVMTLSASACALFPVYYPMIRVLWANRILSYALLVKPFGRSCALFPVYYRKIKVLWANRYDLLRYIILRSFGLTLWPMFGLECYGQISMTCYVMTLSASACALFPVYYRKIRVLWANRYDLLRYIILRPFGLTLWPMFGLECYGQISMTCYVMTLSASACALFHLDENRFELLKKSDDLNTLRLSSYYIERLVNFTKSNYLLRKRRDVAFNEERTIKKQYQVGNTTPSSLDKNEQDADYAVEQDTDNMYYQELSLVETSSNSAIETLINSENAIARYRILFLPEDNVHSPIKRLFTNEEWSIMESNWEKEFLMYSMHWVDGIYLVDQFDGFTIPDTSLDLENLSGIIKIMINFKNRIMKLRAHMKFFLILHLCCLEIFFSTSSIQKKTPSLKCLGAFIVIKKSLAIFSASEYSKVANLVKEYLERNQKKPEDLYNYLKNKSSKHLIDYILLGFSLERGIGTIPNLTKNFLEFQKAAKAEDSMEQLFLKRCYNNAIITSQNRGKAIKLFSKALERSNTSAQINLANCYLNGLGTMKNEEKALELFSKATKVEDTSA